MQNRRISIRPVRLLIRVLKEAESILIQDLSEDRQFGIITAGLVEIVSNLVILIIKSVHVIKCTKSGTIR